jgi:hypothetical protein
VDELQSKLRSTLPDRAEAENAGRFVPTIGNSKFAAHVMASGIVRFRGIADAEMALTDVPCRSEADIDRASPPT